MALRTEPPTGAAHFRGIRHAREVRADVDRVRDEKGEGRDGDQRLGKFETQRSRKSATGDHADARAHELHAPHERPGDERRPKQRRAVLRTGYRVSRDAGRIIIRRAGDQAGTQLAEKSRDGVFRSRFFVAVKGVRGECAAFIFQRIERRYSRGPLLLKAITAAFAFIGRSSPS